MSNIDVSIILRMWKDCEELTQPSGRTSDGGDTHEHTVNPELPLGMAATPLLFKDI